MKIVESVKPVIPKLSINECEFGKCYTHEHFPSLVYMCMADYSGITSKRLMVKLEDGTAVNMSTDKVFTEVDAELHIL